MRTNGVAADPDPPRYLPVSESLGHKHQELQFPPREWTCGCGLSGGFQGFVQSVFRVAGTVEKTAHPVKQGGSRITIEEHSTGAV